MPPRRAGRLAALGRDSAASCALRRPRLLAGPGRAGPPPPLQLLALAPDVDGVGSTPHRAIGCWLGLQLSAAKCGENGLWLWAGRSGEGPPRRPTPAPRGLPSKLVQIEWQAWPIHPRRPAYASCHGSACRRPSGSRPACSKPPGRLEGREHQHSASAISPRKIRQKSWAARLGLSSTSAVGRAVTRQASFSSGPPMPLQAVTSASAGRK